MLWLLKSGFCTQPSPSFVWHPPTRTIAQLRYPSSAVAQWRSPSSGSCYNIHQYFCTWFFMFLLSLIDVCCLVLVKSSLRACVAGCCHLLWHFFCVCSYACCLSPHLRHLLEFPRSFPNTNERKDNMHSHHRNKPTWSKPESAREVPGKVKHPFQRTCVLLAIRHSARISDNTM